MDLYNQCLNVLREIDEITSRTELKEDDKIKKYLELSVKNEKSSLEEARILYHKLVEEDEKVTKQLSHTQQKYSKAVASLDKLEQKCNDLKTQLNDLSTNPVCDDGRNQNETSYLSQSLKAYHDVTGVKFDYDAPPDVVIGLFGIKGNEPKDTYLEHFKFDHKDEDIGEKIWTTIENAVASEVPELTESLNQMDISHRNIM